MKRNENSEIEVLETYAKFLLIALVIGAVAAVFVSKSLETGLIVGALILALGYMLVCLLRVVCGMARDLKELKKK